MKNDWWKGAVIYQVYPRSFNDANGDGVGDIKGITKKLDYIKSLGVDAIWISPFFPSPMKDFGYDVSDYCGVDPLFGDVADFDKMMAEAHKRDIKIVIDMVLSHTSDQHKWFEESRKDRTNPKADWFVWADPKPDGSPPNNWQSVFGGPSWEFDMRRGQYYLHNFLKEQPDLNLHNPAVRKALLDSCRFWLDRGVDGFRLDATTHFFHSPGLKDNPVNPNPRPSSFNINFPVPFSMQLHENDVQIPEAIKFAEEFRAMLDEYQGRMAVAEVGGENGVAVAAQFTNGPKRLHTAYNFSLISGNKPSMFHIKHAMDDFASQNTDSWPSWAFSNHDVVRVASRWGQDENAKNPAFARLLMAVLGSLRGTVFVYQGEELGLSDAKINFDQIQDPWGKYLYPLWQGRDGCRTPMPWTESAKNAGFSKARKTWLPIPEDHRLASVATQEKDKSSPLQFTRAFMAWRKTQDGLVTGGMNFLPCSDDQILAFTRQQKDGKRLVCLFNLSSGAKSYDLHETPVNADSDFKFAGQEGRAEGR
ncbi:MAG: alpha-glucosidase family protein, partial [Alphaproteobacteria bacterium]|nr:alpha-glucosidase family protein [Alphaproteobacteria bacterium]